MTDVRSSNLVAQTYLGDGVYAHVEHGNIVLTTHNGVHETNRIVLEPEVWFRLKEWEKKAS